MSALLFLGVTVSGYMDQSTWAFGYVSHFEHFNPFFPYDLPWVMLVNLQLELFCTKYLPTPMAPYLSTYCIQFYASIILSIHFRGTFGLNLF